MTLKKETRRTVLIAGGGPSGLLLAIMLTRAGVRCRVLERRASPDPHFRSIGIHPVALELLAEQGCASPMVRQGQMIHRGSVWIGNRSVGSISFQQYCPPPYPFILTLPQNRTEAILEARLKRLDPDCLLRGATVTGIREMSDHVQVTCRVEQIVEQETQPWPGRGRKSSGMQRPNQEVKPTRGQPVERGTGQMAGGQRRNRQGSGSTEEVVTFIGSCLIGCDGKESLVRRTAGIQFTGHHYPDTYVMGDFKDRTCLEGEASIYLHHQGLVESFPLPPVEGVAMRRWVVKTDHYHPRDSCMHLCRLLSDRLKIDLDPDDCLADSSFGVHRRIAAQFAQGRLYLAGDAAHVISPIGGQGMNLGWLNVARLSQLIVNRPTSDPALTKDQALLYSRVGKRLARRAARRAALNMWFGRQHRFTLPRELMVRSMVSRPIEPLMARLFTMRGLDAHIKKPRPHRAENRGLKR